MREERASLNDLGRTTFDLGYVGEKNHTRVVIACATMFIQYPDAVATMIVKPPVGDLYPVTLTRSNNVLIWEVSEADLAYAGGGTFQLTFTENNEVIKTVYGRYSVKPSLQGEGEPPEPMADWLEAAAGTLEELQEIIDTGTPVDVATVENHTLKILRALE